MIFRNRIFALGLAALAALAVAQPAQAAYGVYMCAPEATIGAQSRTIGGTGTAVPSQATYSLNGQGCAFIANADVGYFASLGFSGGQNLFSISVVGLTANSTTSNSPTLPAGAYVHQIVLAETTNNAVTGGVDLGTAASGAQVASAVTLSGNGLTFIADSALLKRVFGTGPAPAAQQIFYTCHTGCNSSSVNLTIFYSLF